MLQIEDDILAANCQKTSVGTMVETTYIMFMSEHFQDNLY